MSAAADAEMDSRFGRTEDRQRIGELEAIAELAAHRLESVARIAAPHAAKLAREYAADVRRQVAP